MRKIVALFSAGLLLVAGQAAAAAAGSSSVGDRVGESAGVSSDFAGIPLPVMLIGTAVLVATIVVATNDDSESD